MEAVLIPTDVYKRVRRVELTVKQDGSETLDSLQSLVGGWIEPLPFPGRDDMTCYINEEGKFSLEKNHRATVLMRPVIFPDDWIAGPLVICGFDPYKGVNLPVPEDSLAADLARMGWTPDSAEEYYREAAEYFRDLRENPEPRGRGEDV